MTQEEKARAYDEALKKARFYHGNCPSEPEMKKLEGMFPVLRESEDERIRTELLSSFKGIMADADEDELWYGLPYNDIIAWLEKQKEKKPAIKLVFPKFRVGDIIRNARDKWDKTTRRISYVGEHGYNFDYRHLGDKVSGGSFGFCFEDDYELVEQKPTEWSEEDEKCKNALINICNYPHDEMDDRPWSKWGNWLKSLRPSWKPSKEQIKAVAHAYNSFPNDCSTKSNLRLLYHDLEKLM